jgi:hypothetical protein
MTPRSIDWAKTLARLQPRLLVSQSRDNRCAFNCLMTYGSEHAMPGQAHKVCFRPRAARILMREFYDAVFFEGEP